MKFLLVNDDGIHSERLHFAKKILQKYGVVYTVAPLFEQSGKSVAISIRGIPFERKDDTTYAVDGTPADCVSFALYGLEIKPDVVVSGINKGFNIGIDTMYSGTVGAALQAAFHGYKSVAFSGDFKGETNVQRYFEKTLKTILENHLLSHDYILNVNFPKEVFQDEAEIRHTKLYHVKMVLRGEVRQKNDRSFFYHSREILDQTIPKDSDVMALREGAISISKISLVRDCI